MSSELDTSRKSRFLQLFVLGSMAVVMFLPFLWMIVSALKTGEELAQYPPTFWPRSLEWSNFATAWSSAPFGRFYINSLYTSVAATALQLGTASLMAYALAFIDIPKKNLLILILLGTLMIPDEMKLIPNYLLLDNLGWIDSYWALIIPVGAHAFPVFILYYQFKRIPKENTEAARLEGASHFGVLIHVALPAVQSSLIALTFVVFLGRWNDFLWPLIVTNSESMRTLPVGLVYLQASQEGATRWEVLMAGSLIVMLPALLVFLVVQKYFTKGFRTGMIEE